MQDIVISVRGLSKQYMRGKDQLSLKQIIGMAFPWLSLNPQNKNSETGFSRYGRDAFWALKDITFDLQRGERLGIIGKNGSGKSTLLKILSRVAYPTEGEARIRGKLTSLLEVGTGFNMQLTGRENIYLNMSVYGLEKKEINEKLEEIIEFSGVREFLDTPVKHYSSGMYMRLAFSVSAHLDPDILLLDEVLSVGDLSFQEKCLKRVHGLASEGRTVVFVSHNLDAIKRLCTLCLWLDKGEIVKEGSTEEVVEAYVEEANGVRSSRQWVVDRRVSSQDSLESGTPSLNALDRSSFGSNFENKRDMEISHSSLQSVTPPTEVQSSSTTPKASDGPSSTSFRDSPPGNEFVRLVSARVVNEHGITISSIPVDETLGIEVVYDILKRGKIIQPSFHFKNPQEACAFVVAYTHPTYMRVIPEVGRYVSTAWVPPNLLNIGILYISVVMVTPDPLERHCMVERAVSFHVYERLDGADRTARGLYARGFPGMVRPKLIWKTKQVSGPQPIKSRDFNVKDPSLLSDGHFGEVDG